MGIGWGRGHCLGRGTGYFTFLGCGFHRRLRTERLPPAAWGVGKNLGSSGGKGPFGYSEGMGFLPFREWEAEGEEEGEVGGGRRKEQGTRKI